MKRNALLCGCMGLAMWAGPAITAQAAMINFNLTSPDSATPFAIGNVLTYNDASGLTLTITSWSTTGAGGTLAAARTGIWSGGLGVCNAGEIASTHGCTSPNHAMDNSGYKDFLLFVFSGEVDPLTLTIGWSSSDADVNYWIGSDGTPVLSGLALSGLGTQGFGPEFVDNGAGARTFNAGGGEGFALLVSAKLVQDTPTVVYSRYGTTTITDPNDYVKVKTLAVDYEPPSEVPEPAAYGLVGTALLGLAAIRRKRA